MKKLNTVMIILATFLLCVNVVFSQPRQQPQNRKPPPRTSPQQQANKELEKENSILRQNIHKMQDTKDSIDVELRKKRDSLKEVKDSLRELRIEVERLRKQQYYQIKDLNQNNDSVRKDKAATFRRIERLAETEFRKLVTTPLKNLTEWEVKALMLRRLNEMRAEESRKTKNNRIRPLKYDDRVERVAQIFSIEKNPYPYCYPAFSPEREVCTRLEHLSLDGTTLTGRFSNQRIFENIRAKRKPSKGGREGSGENVYAIFDMQNRTVEWILQGFYDSPGHKSNMLTDFWNTVGFGYFKGTTRFVQNFAYLEDRR